MNELTKLKSRIATPVATYGVSSVRGTPSAVVYDGQPLPAFLLKQNSIENYREFLSANRIGDPFEELIPGLEVVVDRDAHPTQRSFPSHLEA